MSVWVTGDVHDSIDIGKLSGRRWPEGKGLTRDDLLIVCGDFNTSPISYAHRVIGRGLDDAFVESGFGMGISYHRNGFYFRIDHILTSPDLKAYRCTVDSRIDNSDHYPIWCNIAPAR